jgi:flagellar hook-length control protein FliK
MVLHADGPDLSADLGERISWQLQQGLGEATIELHPAELGALTIRIETQAQQAQVHILAAEPAARALISQCLPQLRELLGASGLTLTRGQVESAERRGGQLGTGSDGLLSPRGARRRVTSVTLVDTYA